MSDENETIQASEAPPASEDAPEAPPANGAAPEAPPASEAAPRRKRGRGGRPKGSRNKPKPAPAADGLAIDAPPAAPGPDEPPAGEDPPPAGESVPPPGFKIDAAAAARALRQVAFRPGTLVGDTFLAPGGPGDTWELVTAWWIKDLLKDVDPESIRQAAPVIVLLPPAASWAEPLVRRWL